MSLASQTSAGTNARPYVATWPRSARRRTGSEPRPPCLFSACHSVWSRKSPAMWDTTSTTKTSVQLIAATYPAPLRGDRAEIGRERELELADHRRPGLPAVVERSGQERGEQVDADRRDDPASAGRERLAGEHRLDAPHKLDPQT